MSTQANVCNLVFVLIFNVMDTLILYTTEGCHLCELAEQMLAKAQNTRQFFLESIDISTDEELIVTYGIRIPVVKNKLTNEEVEWPFLPEDLIGLF